MVDQDISVGELEGPRIDRQTTLRMLAAAGITGLAGYSGDGGDGGDGGDMTEGSNRGDGGSSASFVEESRIKAALPQEIGTPDPAIATGLVEQIVVGNLYDALVFPTAGGELEPHIASG